MLLKIQCYHLYTDVSCIKSNYSKDSCRFCICYQLSSILRGEFKFSAIIVMRVAVTNLDSICSAGKFELILNNPFINKNYRLYFFVWYLFLYLNGQSTGCNAENS